MEAGTGLHFFWMYGHPLVEYTQRIFNLIDRFVIDSIDIQDGECADFTDDSILQSVCLCS